MTTPWDVDATNLHVKPTSPISSHHTPGRKKLQLKPRSIPLETGVPAISTYPVHDHKGIAGFGSKCDPFGDAMPREEVLRRRSLDHHQTTDFQSEVCLSTPDTLPRCRRVKSISSKGSPFGDAVPREQVLWQRGIDPSDLDLRIDQKAHHTYTPRQDAELDAVQRELTHLEVLQRDLNEKELPEEDIRAAVEAKREELHALMDHFKRINNESSPELSHRRH